MEFVYARKMAVYFRIFSYTIVFWRFTWHSIRIVYLRNHIWRNTIVYEQIQSKTEAVYDMRIRRQQTSVYLSVNDRISPYTARRYTIVILSHVKHRISLFDLGEL
jgi:hypothetical protein